MKRAFQFAAAVVVSLLALQPALAGLACASSGMASATCPMGMSAMGPDCPDCPMAQGRTADCTQDCCNHSSSAVVLPAAPDKPKLLLASTASSSVVASESNIATRPGRLPAVAASSSPPHYIANRVLRI